MTKTDEILCSKGFELISNIDSICIYRKRYARRFALEVYITSFDLYFQNYDMKTKRDYVFSLSTEELLLFLAKQTELRGEE